ncbi:MAG TPA: MBL fold metallo-hydrolase [Thermoanaerobaculia bacterium]|nr:MBL fold metallo-hydrolase [Thermoanaerobaculia bacterium]
MPETTLYRLADATAVEPLINHWSVWSDLIAPVTHSYHVANYQIKTLQSYLQKPEVHLKASRDPELVGGPWVDVPEERSSEVKELLVRTLREERDNLALAKAATEFQVTLSKEAKGQSIEQFYARIPEPLRGYVELLYDYFNNPIVRFMEPLLYRSPYYKRHLQSLRLFLQRSDHHRRFFLSTPRLPEDDQIDWRVPFDDRRIDDLFRLDLEPQPLDRIREILGLDPDQDDRLLPLLSDELPPRRPVWDGSDVHIRYLGHACVLIEYKGVSLMVDPWLSVLSGERTVERFSYGDLPERIDFAMISHGHHDHFVMETLLRLRHRLGTLVVPRSYGMFYADNSLRHAATACGFPNVVEVDALDSIPFPGGEIVAVPFFGEHADLAHGKSGYVVRAGNRRILLAADSNCLDPRVYENLRAAVGKVDTVFMGMECVGAPLSWLYGALMPVKLDRTYDQTRRTQACDAKRGKEMVKALGAERVYNYAMGSEPWLEYAMGLGNTEVSPQIEESDRFLAEVGGSLAEAARLYGKFESYLPAA